jgi:hypothetical protein
MPPILFSKINYQVEQQQSKPWIIEEIYCNDIPYDFFSKRKKILMCIEVLADKKYITLRL